MNAVLVARELPGILLGPLMCRVAGRHRWHVWAHHAAPALQICVRCGRTPKESR